MNRWLRLAVVALPALLLLSSLATLVMSLPAWGAGNHAGLPAWMPAAAGIIMGLPAAIIAAVCLRNVLHSTRGAFSVTPLLLTFGLLALPIAIATQSAVAVGVADPATYDRLLEDDATAGFDGGPPPGPMSPASFMAGTAIISLILNGVVAIAATIYASAITTYAKRFERQPGEYDAVAEMLKGRHGPGAPYL